MVYLVVAVAFFILQSRLKVVLFLLYFSALLAISSRKTTRKLKRQMWIGTAATHFVDIFYTVASNLWENSESIWGNYSKRHRRSVLWTYDFKNIGAIFSP